MRAVWVSGFGFAATRPWKNMTWRVWVFSGVRRHCARCGHGTQSRFAPRNGSPTRPLITRLRPLR